MAAALPQGVEMAQGLTTVISGAVVREVMVVGTVMVMGTVLGAGAVAVSIRQLVTCPTYGRGSGYCDLQVNSLQRPLDGRVRRRFGP